MKHINKDTVFSAANRIESGIRSILKAKLRNLDRYNVDWDNKNVVKNKNGQFLSTLDIENVFEIELTDKCEVSKKNFTSTIEYLDRKIFNVNANLIEEIRQLNEKNNFILNNKPKFKIGNVIKCLDLKIIGIDILSDRYIYTVTNKTGQEYKRCENDLTATIKQKKQNDFKTI